jgi:hypothetical protein
MDPLVTAAWIAAGVSLLSLGGTVLVAIAGFRNTRKATIQTVEAGAANTVLALDAARDDRLWDKRADAYVDAIKELRRGQLTREDRTRILRYDEATEKRIADWLATYRTPHDWPEIEARLYAFASQPVLDALKASSAANAEVAALLARGDSTAADAREAKAAGMPPNVIGSHGTDWHAVRQALGIAETRDDELIEAIRGELQDKPSRALIPAHDRRPAVAKTRRWSTRAARR